MEKAVNRDIELKSEELEDVFERPPHWIIKLGASMMFLVLVLMLLGAYVIKYPDLQVSNIEIKSQWPPINLICQANGKLEKLFLLDKDQVNKGDIIAVVETSADYKDVLEVEKRLSSLDGLLDSSGANTKLDADSLKLGGIQSTYASFSTDLFNYLQFSTSNYRRQQLISLQSQLKDNRENRRQLETKLDVMTMELELANRQLKRDSILFKKRVMSPAEYERSASIHLNTRVAHLNVASELSTNAAQYNQLQNSFNELQIQNEEQENRLWNTLNESYRVLVKEIEEWKLMNLFISPVDGTIAFHATLGENEFLNAGDVFCSVIPAEGGLFVGNIALPVKGSGKVKPAQRVQISLDSYPSTEFGTVLGVVKSISLVPYNNQEGSFYTVLVDLPNGLRTNYNRDLQFTQNMKGQAKIVTNDRRLLERFFDPIASFINTQNNGHN